MEDVRVLCFGAGGHASVVVDLLHTLSSTLPITLVGLIAKGANSSTVLGAPVLGGDDDVVEIAVSNSATHFVVAVGMTRGGGQLRRNLFELGLSVGLKPFTAVHPSAVVAQSAALGPGTVVMAGAVIQSNCRVGANVIINTRASLDHDCAVEDHSHVAPGAICSGGVSIGVMAHVGVGAVIIENVRVGGAATVGAGAVVISDCADGAIVVGVPARPLVFK